MQSGLDLSVQKFWFASAVLGTLLALGVLIAGWYVALPAGLVGLLGLPRWFLFYLRKRRQAAFLGEFADAIDIMVRGIKAGLPLPDAMKVIAAETPVPVGPEFLEVVEGQRVGIAIDQGIERMFERMPLAEVNFLGIVIAMQAKTGGNLAEALANLSKVLRDRKRMKQKIAAVSQEAKASATIIGSLPFCICGALSILNPEYLIPLWDTAIGHLMIAGSLVWMASGVLIMRKMINFDF
ncbi:MAG: type II secretion system F family protein [Aestuariivirgaceae bacterium]